MRRPYIDWLRGLAVLIMMEWHAVDAWTAADSRGSEAFRVAALVGGWAAPLFLFLAGVAIPFAGLSNMRKGGVDRRAAARAMQVRGWQVFALAHLFRFQSFLFDLSAPWSSLFKPDILNILGLGLVAAAFAWGRGTTPRMLAVYLLVPATIAMRLAPWATVWEWPAVLPPRLEAYIRPVGNYGVFTLFPWIAFVFVGAYVGGLLAGDRDPAADRLVHHRLAIAGLMVAAAGFVGRSLPSAAPTEFWTTSISFFVIRVGVMTSALAAAWWWFQRPTHRRWSPLVLFGRTSLFVYWVHVALAYGAFSAPLHRALPFGWALVAFGMLTLLMLGLAIWWSGRGPLLRASVKNGEARLSVRGVRRVRGTN